MTRIPPDWEIETRALRAAANRAGIVGLVDPRDLGVELESADQLLARLRKDAPHDELAERRTSRRRRAILFASSVAAVGVLGAGVLQPWSSAPVQAATPALLDYEFADVDAIATATGKDAGVVLEGLASAAGARPESDGSGTQHVVTDSWFADIDTRTDDTSALIPQISENWLAPDGSLRIVERRDDPLPADGRGLPDEGAWDDQPATADDTQPAGSIDPDLVADLPTDPAALREALLELSGCPDTEPGTGRSLCLFDQVLALHLTYVVPPDLDAALWEMLADEQGFRSLGDVDDRVGRPGVGISLIADERPEYRLVLIADPHTGRLLGTEQILISSVEDLKIKAPAITGFTAILESRFVD
ncbi:MAG: CU044_5270 family protein [Aeromicrobium sp.]